MMNRTDPPTDIETNELEGLRAANAERINTLSARLGAAIDLNGGLLDHLIDEVIPAGTWWRHDFCLRWETKASKLLDGIEEQIRKAILLNGGR